MANEKQNNKEIVVINKYSENFKASLNNYDPLLNYKSDFHFIMFKYVTEGRLSNAALYCSNTSK